MRERLTTWLLVTMIAVVVWLYAEAETRDTIEVPVRVQLSGAGSGWLIRPPADWDRRVQIEMQGSRGALSRARDLLASPLAFAPGDPGVPARAGVQTANLLDALRDHAELGTTGVSVLSARPLSIELTISEIVERQVSVRGSFAGIIETEDGIAVSPAEVTIRGPAEYLAALSEDMTAEIDVDPSVIAALPIGESATVDAFVMLPEPLLASQGIEVAPRIVEVTLTPAGRAEAVTVNAPVWVRLPPIEVGRWRVRLEQADRFKQVTVRGPRELVERFRPGGGDAIIVELTLLSDELSERAGEKAVVLSSRSGLALPAELDLSIEDPEVTWSAESLDDVP